MNVPKSDKATQLGGYFGCALCAHITVAAEYGKSLLLPQRCIPAQGLRAVNTASLSLQLCPTTSCFIH